MKPVDIGYLGGLVVGSSVMAISYELTGSPWTGVFGVLFTVSIPLVFGRSNKL